LFQRIHQACVSIAAMRISPREAYPNLGCRDMELLCRRRAALDNTVGSGLAKRNAGETSRTVKLLLVFKRWVEVQWPWVRV
jgi:hypothetical protein